MIYSCKSCHFIFERTGEISDCPDCNKQTVYEATTEEKETYNKSRSVTETSADKEPPSVKQSSE